MKAYEYPPYNGFGDELDSLGNCNRLINKGPKKIISSILTMTRLF